MSSSSSKLFPIKYDVHHTKKLKAEKALSKVLSRCYDEVLMSILANGLKFLARANLSKRVLAIKCVSSWQKGRPILQVMVLASTIREQEQLSIFLDLRRVEIKGQDDTLQLKIKTPVLTKTNILVENHIPFQSSITLLQLVQFCASFNESSFPSSF